MNGSITLALLFALAALFSLYQLFHRSDNIESYLADREAHAAHAVMNGAMSAMFSSYYGTLAEHMALILLALAALVLALRFLVAMRSGQTSDAGGSAYHFLAVAAMLYAIWITPVAHHDMAMTHAMGSMAHEQSTNWLSRTFALLFLCDGILSAILVWFFPAKVMSLAEYIGKDASSAKASRVAALRRSAIPHVIMDLGMALMLW